ncbi:MAG: hypothetical protein KTR30_36485 [Saprospiraceae bacterium]|nr:hypothetical protein [Saprospiraceae bacterium]
MKEDNIKRLVQESEMEPSEDFMMKLLVAVEQQPEKEGDFRWIFLLALLSFLALAGGLLLVIQRLAESGELRGIHIALSPIAIRIGFIVFVLIVGQQLFLLGQKIQAIRLQSNLN